MSSKKILVFTDNCYISAILFHGYGLPPWHDLPEVQEDVDYRNKMTDTVNEIIQKAEKDGFEQFDIHEAFPINFMTISEKVQILRNIDHFLIERSYAAVAFAKVKFDSLKKQPGLSLIKKITLNDHDINETELLKIYFQSKSIPIYNGQKIELEACGRLRIEFDKKVSLKYVNEHPFIQQEGCAIEAEINNSEKLLEVYSYAGIQIQSNG